MKDANRKSGNVSEPFGAVGKVSKVPPRGNIGRSVSFNEIYGRAA